MRLFLISVIFCGCSIDTAFDTPQGTALWGASFAVALISAATMGKGQA